MAHPFEKLFRDYARCFDDFDVEGVAAFFHCPCLLVNGEFVSSLSTRNAILLNVEGLLEFHREQGVGRASASDIRVEFQAENLAIVQVRWRVDDREGAPVGNWRNTYNLVDHGSGWRILVSTTHSNDA